MARVDTRRNASAGFACGMASGVIQSAVFNAYDRALYQSVVSKRPFLNIENWRGNPLSGVSPSFLHRSISAGLYFPLEDLFRRGVSDSHAVDGLLVGLVGGAFTTPFNSIKYAMWSDTTGSKTMSKTAVELYRRGGVTRLMRGVLPTLYRDMTFGVTFSYLRHQGDNGFINNVAAASVATALSAPFNYARLKIYGTETELGTATRAKTTLEVFKQLHVDVSAREGLFTRAKFLVQTLNIGWGALRLGLGMGVSSQIYNSCVGRSADD